MNDISRNIDYVIYCFGNKQITYIVLLYSGFFYEMKAIQIAIRSIVGFD